MIFYIFGFILCIILIYIFLLVYKFTKKNRLTNVDKKKLINKYNKIINSGVSYKEKIIDLDKLFHLILQELGYMGSFGDILKQNPKEIGNINKIWELHKLRNKLVHDFDLLSDGVLKDKFNQYKKEIKKFLY